ncbi:MAG: hypothetical protein E7565_07290 [Ruminococcaceae bacterium]|nr:hypothetical protein [Oscillospiraceae bacterium]
MLKKKISALFISVLLIISVFSIPANAWVQYTKPNEVKGSDYTDNAAFAKALDDLFAGDIDLYKDSKRTKEVSMPLGFRVSMNDPYYMYSTSKGTQTYGWTCFIYSNGAFNKLFGEYVHRGTGLKNCYIAVGKGASKMTYDLLKNADIKAGAYIRTSPKSDGSYYGEDGHSMIILGYDKTYITYLEGNGDGKGLVRVTKRTYAEFNSAQLTGRGRKITHIVQPTEEWFNTLYPATYTFSYDANGGNGESDDITVPYNTEFSLNGDAFDHYEYDISGFNLKREKDGKWLTKNGWVEENAITAENPRCLIKSGEVLIVDKSYISDFKDDLSYTAYAVWEKPPYQKCVSARLISENKRDSYPLNSTVSFEGSVIEFTFESGNKTQVTVLRSCNAETAQTFRFNKHNYSFCIDGSVKNEGDNVCFITVDGIKTELSTVKGGKEIESINVSGQPTAVWGENASFTLDYNGESETVKAIGFNLISADDFVVGQILTDAGFYIDWKYSVTTGESPAVTYPCGATFNLTYGDINMDGSITTIDLAALKLILSERYTDCFKAYITGDINKDNQISTLDLAEIKLTLAGI